MATATAKAIHCFEKAGLGKAPFEYIGMVDQEIAYGQCVIGNVGGVTETTKPGGTCAYCGTYIVNMFNVRSADGRVFHVGCECILKTGDAGFRKIAAQPHPNEYRAIERFETLRDYVDWLLAK